MTYTSLIIMTISIVLMVNSSYNPIPIGSIIVSTIRTISIIQPKEYGGTNKPIIIFTANENITIINTIFDPQLRELYIIFLNRTNNILYVSQLKSVENLHSIFYRLPISFNILYLNNLTSFSSDITNKRAFFIDQIGNVIMFSMSGSMKINLSIPSTINNPIRSVSYNEKLNRLFIITDFTVDSCIKLDENNLQCCQALSKTNQLRSITFDLLKSDSYAYVIDEQSGIYEVPLDSFGCPIRLSPIFGIRNYQHRNLIIYQDLKVFSGYYNNSNMNSIKILDNDTIIPQTIEFDTTIVSLHISYPNYQSIINNDETCFHGLTYHDYRIAVILAAIFGTIMGIFMCLNILFCIDFIMTKHIIRDLKTQIPHNLLEDRWNKLIQEKYARLALEAHRKKDDPPPKRKSSAAARKSLINNNNHNNNIDVNLGVSNPIPRISAYIRRKSEGYLSRRRSDDYRVRSKTIPTTTDTVPIHSKEIKEEESKGLRDNMSHHDFTKTEGELL